MSERYDWATEEEKRAITRAFLAGSEIAALAHEHDCDREAIEEIVRDFIVLRAGGEP